MAGIKFEKNDCPCLRCMYLIQVTKINEEANGNCDLRINCAISGCLKGFTNKKGKIITGNQDTGAYQKISSCIQMIKRCIELKSNGGE